MFELPLTFRKDEYIYSLDRCRIISVDFATSWGWMVPFARKSKVAATEVPYPRRQDVPNNAPHFEDPIGSCSLVLVKQGVSNSSADQKGHWKRNSLLLQHGSLPWPWPSFPFQTSWRTSHLWCLQTTLNPPKPPRFLTTRKRQGLLHQGCFSTSFLRRQEFEEFFRSGHAKVPPNNVVPAFSMIQNTEIQKKKSEP